MDEIYSYTASKILTFPYDPSNSKNVALAAVVNVTRTFRTSDPLGGLNS